MSDALSNDWEQHLLQYSFNSNSLTRPTTLYLALHTASPTDADSGANEISGNGYARQTITFGTVSGNTATSNATVTFPACTGSAWGNVTHCSIHTASTSGTMICHSSLTSSKNIRVGDILQVQSGSISVTLT